MKTVKGIYAEAKIFTDDVEDYALAQVKKKARNKTLTEQFLQGIGNLSCRFFYIKL